MGKVRGLREKDARGMSLVEVIMAISIVGAAAVTVMPIVYESKKVNLHAEFYDMCVNAARAKINEYKFGLQTNTGGAANLTADTVGAGGGVYNGFLYAKSRYNADRAGYCPSVGATTVPVPVTAIPPTTAVPAGALTDLGRRECIVGIGPGPGVPNTPLACQAASLVDTQMLNVAPNFQIYVNLRRYNPILPIANNEDCPWYGAAAPPRNTNNYDFQLAGDMIKITVTGMFDLQPGQTYAGITRPAAGGFNPKQRELTCQVTDYLKPFTQIARYWLNSEGNVFRWIGSGQDNVAGQPLRVLNAVSSQGNYAISVSPDNQFVYVLRPGKLLRYGSAAAPCGGDPFDCPLAPAPTEWTVNANITSMTAKWLPLPNPPGAGIPHTPNPVCAAAPGTGAPQPGLPIIFGLLADRQTAICMDMSACPLGCDMRPLPLTQVHTAAAPVVPFQIPTVNRVHSIFMDPTASTTFVVDTSCSIPLASSTFCGGIYDSNDRNMRFPLEIFHVKAIAFSK